MSLTNWEATSQPGVYRKYFTDDTIGIFSALEDDVEGYDQFYLAFPVTDDLSRYDVYDNFPTYSDKLIWTQKLILMETLRPFHLGLYVRSSFGFKPALRPNKYIRAENVARAYLPQWAYKADREGLINPHKKNKCPEGYYRQNTYAGPVWLKKEAE